MSRALAIDSPLGPLTVAATGDAVVSIRFADEGDGVATPLLAEAARQLQAYFAGRLTAFHLPLAPAGSDFERRVWRAMQEIPFGQTCSYGELALETSSAPRAVGRACGRNPIPIVIPCHRVTAKKGLGGYSGGAGLETKRALLALEGTPGAPPGLGFAPVGTGLRRQA